MAPTGRPRGRLRTGTRPTPAHADELPEGWVTVRLPATRALRALIAEIEAYPSDKLGLLPNTPLDLKLGYVIALGYRAALSAYGEAIVAVVRAAIERAGREREAGTTR